MTDNNDYRHGHRARLHAEFDNDENSLNAERILEALLFKVTPRVDTKPMARALLKKFNGFYGVLTAPAKELTTVPGIGIGAARFLRLLRAAFSMAHENKLRNDSIYHDAFAFENYCRLELMNKPVEEVHVLYMDKNYRLLAKDIHSRGTTDAAIIYPETILNRAVELHAKNVAMMHNHPSGIGAFSTDDIKLTAQVKHVLTAAEIEFYDHCLVANGLVFSAKNDIATWRMIVEGAAAFATADMEKHLKDFKKSK